MSLAKGFFSGRTNPRLSDVSLELQRGPLASVPSAWLLRKPGSFGGEESNGDSVGNELLGVGG